MSGITNPRIDNGPQFAPRLDHCVLEPGGGLVWTKEIARANDHRAYTLRGGSFEHRFHLNPDAALAGEGFLRRVFGDDCASIRTEIIYITWEDEPSAAGTRGHD